jgi:protein-lysine N-methyltransferase EEF2KMT
MSNSVSSTFVEGQLFSNDMIVVHLWCGPRSMSTCTMYSFAQRPDTTVVDEPLYPHWLQTNPDVYRPYRTELLERSPDSGDVVLRGIKDKLEPGKNILFLKHISKQVVGIDRSVLYEKNCRHVFLVRDPLEMIMSWEVKSGVHKEECTLDSLGLPVLVDLYSSIRKNTGVAPFVVDSNMLKENPEPILKELCESLHIPYFSQQLTWPVGPKPAIDGYVLCI